MDIILKIDNREPEAIKSEFPNAVFDNLIVGDFIFEGKHDNIPRLIVERKTVNDLLCSIKDGRFRDQRTRMLDTNVKIVYIIEGKISTDKCVLGALENLALRHNICVIPTANESQTVTVVKSLCTKIGQNYIQPVNRYVVGKRKHDTNKNSLEKMLETILGISPSIAASIAQHYPSVLEFTKALEKNPNTLYGMELSSKRKLGPKLAQRISDAFLN